MSDNSTKELVFGPEARAKLLEGVNILADAVRITMGPRGQNVVIERPNMAPHLTKDGVTVAQAVNIRERFTNLGVQMIKEAAARTAEVAGDGTTTAIVLSQAIYSEGLKMIAAGYPSAEIQRGIRFGAEHVQHALKELAEPVRSDEEIIQVGTISANGDREVAELLCKAMSEVGRDGVITVEEAKGFDTSLDVVDGMEINRGYMSPYFINDQARMAAVLENPYILLINKKLLSIKDLLPVLEQIHQTQRPLLVVADDVAGDAMQGLVVNKMKGTLSVCVIRAPEFGESRVAALGDLGIMLNTTALPSSTTEDDLKALTIDDLGTCKKVVVTKLSTTFVDCAGNSCDIEERVTHIKGLLHDPGVSQQEHDVLSRRLRRMAGGVAILRVGAATEIALREKKDRVEDALCATQAAVEEGILPGGGVALVRVSRGLEKLRTGKDIDGVQVGIDVLRRACVYPLRQIVENSGGSAEVVLEKVLRLKGNKGFDAKELEFVDMLESGIIDPLKVVRSALENAVSVACSLLSVGCSIVEDQNTSPNEWDVVSTQ
jgi:chaperonin GroEL